MTSYRSFKLVLLSCISGLLLVLAFPKPDMGMVAWFALVPLFYALNRSRTEWEALACGFTGGLAFYLGLLYWIYITCRVAGVPAGFSFLAWAGLSSVMALNWVLFAVGVFAFRRCLGANSAVLWAALWVMLEFFSARWTTQFPWGLLGYTQWRYPLVLQVASGAGVYAISFVLVAVNAALAFCICEKPFRVGMVIRHCFAPACLVALAVGSGMATFGLSSREGGGKISVSILQGNVDQYKKWDSDFAKEIRDIYESLSEEAARSRSQILFWPESAVPGWIDEKRHLMWVSGIARKTNSFHLVGGASRNGNLSFNSAYFFSPNGTPLGIYSKRQLVPFGEKIPFRSILGRWVGVLNELGEFSPGGADQEPMGIFWGSISPSICYEIIFPHLIRNNSEKGGRLLVNLTNDGWYLDTAGPYQHFAMSVLRAVENRCYLVRAANTGISAVVDPYGFVVARMDLNRRGVLEGNLHIPWLRLAPSFYALNGDIFAWLCSAASFGVLAASLVFRGRRTSP